ncbi:MAG: hypothetical protein ACOYNS_17875 [Bacteroidota bacterium]
MEPSKNTFRYNLFSVLCGSVFLLTAWIWTYFLNLFIALPFGLLALFFWRQGQTPGSRNPLNTFALSIIIAGLIAAVSALFLYR